MELSVTVPGSNATKREHLKLAAPNHPLLQPFEMSPYEHYIMVVFWQLCRDRVQGFSGPGPISLQSIVFYQQLFSDVLNTDEIEIIQRLDQVYLTTISDLREE